MRATAKNESDIISLLITGYPSTVTNKVCAYVHKYESEPPGISKEIIIWGASTGQFLKPFHAEDF